MWFGELILYQVFLLINITYILCSAVKCKNVESVNIFATLFRSQANITLVQHDRFNSTNLLVTTDRDVYTDPIEGSDGAEHIIGKDVS